MCSQGRSGLSGLVSLCFPSSGVWGRGPCFPMLTLSPPTDTHACLEALALTLIWSLDEDHHSLRMGVGDPCQLPLAGLPHNLLSPSHDLPNGCWGFLGVSVASIQFQP